MKIGVCGLGFGAQFAHTMRLHPDVEEVVGAEADPQKAERIRARLDLRRLVASLDELCDSDVDAIAIFTPPWLHAEHTLRALSAGKHVFCACPMALRLADVQAVIDKTKETGLIYMTAETSYYYPDVVHCRNKHDEGHFGDIISSRASYLYSPAHSGYDFWQRDLYASFPALHYATHSTARILGVMGSRFTEVSARGHTSFAASLAGRKRLPEYQDNVHANMRAFLAMANGSTSEICEYRDSPVSGEYFSLHGTKSFYGAPETMHRAMVSGWHVEALEWLFDPYKTKEFPSALPNGHPHLELLRRIPAPRGSRWSPPAHAGSHI